MPPRRHSSSSEEKKPTKSRRKSSPSSPDPVTIRAHRSPARSPIGTPVKITGKRTLPPSGPRKKTAFRYESDDEKRPRGKGIIPDSDSEDSSSESEDELINRMANVAVHNPESKAEKIPASILSKIASFLSNSDRPTMSLISSTMRKAVRDTPVDLSEINFSYTNLIKFLKSNPGLKITGLKIIPSSEDLSELRPYLHNLTKLIVINADKVSSMDYSVLSECKKLTHCEIKQEGKILPYLINCEELEYLEIEGSEEDDLTVENKKLRYLKMYGSPEGELNLTKCKKLRSLMMYDANLESIKLPINNSLRDLLIVNVDDVDFSFLAMCKSLKILEISSRGSTFDLDILSGLNELEILNLNHLKINGNLNKMARLKKLTLKVSKLGSSTYSELPNLPASLKSLEIIPWSDDNYETNFSLEPLLECPNLRNLFIKLQKCNINLKHLKNCVNLNNLHLIVNDIQKTKSLEKLTSLTNLNLFIGGTINIDAKLYKCPLLKTVRLISPEINSINFLENCINLTELFIHSESMSPLDVLRTCINLEKITIKGYNIADISPLFSLNRLTVVAISRPRILERQRKELKRMGFRREINADGLPLASYRRVETTTNMDMAE